MKQKENRHHILLMKVFYQYKTRENHDEKIDFTTLKCKMSKHHKPQKLEIQVTRTCKKCSTLLVLKNTN